MFVLHVSEEYDSILESTFKTEFLTVLNKKFQETLQQKLMVNFNDS